MTITLGELRDIVREEFGERLERATPASVRDFLDRLQVRLHRDSGEGAPYMIEGDERARSYEEIIADFFSRVLDYGPEQAAVMLWLLAFEQHFAIMEDDYAQRSRALFGEGEAG